MKGDVANVRHLVNLPAKRLAQLQIKNVKEIKKASFWPQFWLVWLRLSSLGGFVAVEFF